MNSNRPNLVQISISRSIEEGLVVPVHLTSASQRRSELDMFRKNISTGLEGVITPVGSTQATEFPADPKSTQVPSGFLDRVSPNAIAISAQMLARIKQLHTLLGRALVDVVERWFTDEQAQLPRRMPLDTAEEDLLRWVASGEQVPKYSEHIGVWRSDVLLGKSPSGLDDEAPQICELNGRLPLNGIMMMGHHANGVTQFSDSKHQFETLDSLEESCRQIMSFFDTKKPLYNIGNEWHPFDSAMFLDAYSKQTGQPVGVVKPGDLEIREDARSSNGYSLWDKSNNIRLDQWFMEMFQSEWASLSPAVARHVALTPLNDVRTVFLVHDKRMLGIVRQELPGMVERGVLTAEEADIVDAGIIKTLIPGSEEIKALLQKSSVDSTVKDNYIYKPCRGGVGDGIVLGRNLSQDDWLARLEPLAQPDPLQPHQGAAVIQELVSHYWYDIVRHELPQDTGAEPEKFHLIASIYMFQSKDFYAGPWRLGLETHLGLGPGSLGIAMGSVHLPDVPFYSEQAKRT